MDPWDGVDINPLENFPDNPVADATLMLVGIAEHIRTHGGLGLSSLYDARANGRVEDVQAFLA
jgi:hypothetical protein